MRQELFGERIAGERMLKALKAEREFKLTSKQFVHNIYDTCMRQVGLCCLRRRRWDYSLALLLVWRSHVSVTLPSATPSHEVSCSLLRSVYACGGKL